MTVINTPEEAYLLPVGTIIRLGAEQAAIKTDIFYWLLTGCDSHERLERGDFPAIVVWTPGDEE